MEDEKKGKVLLIDDEEDLVMSIRRGLEKEDYEVVSTTDSREAVDIFDATSPDLVLLDIMMPYKDGYQVAKEIREQSPNAVPIVFLTVKNSMEDIIGGLEGYAEEYITKPFNFKYLLAKVNILLKRAKKYKELEKQLEGYKKDIQLKEHYPENILTYDERNALFHLVKNEEIKYDTVTEVVPLDGNGERINNHIPMETMDTLHEKGYCHVQEERTHISCPHCNSINTNPELSCPTCGNKTLSTSQTIEHFSCGYIGKSSEFSTGGSRMVCPKCRKYLSAIGVDYRKPGVWFSCHNGHLFGLPWVSYRCNNDNKSFNLEEGNLVHLKTYELNREKEEQAKSNAINFEIIKEQLEDEKTRVELGGGLKNEEDLYFSFDVVIRENDKIICADIDTTGEEKAVMEFVVKYQETTPHTGVFISMEPLPQKVKQFAISKGVKVFEDKKPESYVEILKRFLT